MIHIDILPDDVLLGIFYFYVEIMKLPWLFISKTEVEKWQSLVHVCRRWRSLVLGSPRFLNLQLYCSHKTRVKDALDVWPALPLIVEGNTDLTSGKSGTDNIIAALGQSNRICKITIEGFLDRKSEEILASMQMPFPELTELRLSSYSYDEMLSIIPDSFLGGSAPRLQAFALDGIPFPGLPKLLLTSTNLVYLWLSRIPHSGYISPEVTVTLLSALSRLETLSLGFRSPQSCPNLETRRPPPPKRFVIPALTTLEFNGVIEYLEDLVTLVDTPRLYRMQINFFNQIDFVIPRLAQFINRTPKLWKPDAHVQFDNYNARVVLQRGFDPLQISISCQEPDWQLSSIEQVCNSSLQPVSTAENLYIEHRYRNLVWKDGSIENTLWLQFLLPFMSVKNLYLSEKFAPGIAAALQDLTGDRITEVLPSLQNMFVKGLELSGPLQKSIGQFIAARQLSNHPIAISDWDEADSGTQSK